MNRFSLTRITQAMLVLALLLVGAMPSFAQVSVSLPETAGEAGTTGMIPVTVGDLTDSDVIAYSFVVEFDPTVVQITGASVDGTISEGLEFAENVGDGTYALALATAMALEGEGVLLNLEASFVAEGTSDLAFTSFIFNEGDPEAETADGSVTVVEPCPDPPAGPHAPGAQIAANASFQCSELGPTTDEPFWSFNLDVNGADAEFEIVADAQDGDDRALQIDFGTFNGAGDDWHVEAVNEPFFPQAGDRIRASIWIRADSDERVARLYLGLPESGGWARPLVQDIELTDEWAEYAVEYTVTANDEANSMRFAIALNFAANDGGVFDIDNLRVTILCPDPPMPPHAPGAQMAANASFECSDLGPTTDEPFWSFNLDVNGADAEFEIVADAQDGDDRALQIDFGTFNGAGDDWHVEAVNEPFFPQAGDRIRASIWMRADSDERVARLYLGLPESGGWARPLVQDIELTDEWAEYALEYTVTANDEANSMRFAIALNFAANDGGVFDIDNLRVTTLCPDPPMPPHAFGAQIASNASFECSDLGPTTGEPFWSFNITQSGANAEFEIVDDAHDGDDRALQINFGTWNNMGDDWHVEAVNEPFFPAAGDVIRASVWIRADSNERTARLYLGLPESGGWARPLEQVVDLTDDWAEYAVEYTVTPNDETNSMRFAIALNFQANDGGVFHIDHLTVTKQETNSTDPGDLPFQFALGQNYPNPFNPATNISYELENVGHVTLRVFNALGQRVATLVDGVQQAGSHQVQFEARSLTSGVYFYQLRAGGRVMTRSMQLLK